ncbi:MAG: type II toxin-antitoxin system RelE/ParE family toxin [Actinomycetaceae bacterium]|nr:type II toxin-antitoxin system RelE/ParE family toxin [Actinomycetaceae bacterium]
MTLEIRYANKKLERACTDFTEMRKKYSADVAKKLRLRLNELRAATSFQDLPKMLGRWEQLSADRSGTWSARLTKNWRIIVKDISNTSSENSTSEIALVIEIVDYH